MLDRPLFDERSIHHRPNQRLARGKRPRDLERGGLAVDERDERSRGVRGPIRPCCR
jgi:hypothetical protein